MKIVIIDDQKLVLDGLKMLISKHNATLDVECFDDVHLAYNHIKEYGADIIITDIQMPMIDGLELCKKIREFNDAQIIIISGFENFNYAKTAFGLGVLNYILKPINQNEFLPILDHAIMRVNENKNKHKSIISKMLHNITFGVNDTEYLRDVLTSVYNGTLPNYYCLCILLLNEHGVDELCEDVNHRVGGDSKNKNESIFNTIILSMVECSTYNILFAPTNLDQFLFLFPDVREECQFFISSLINEVEKSVPFKLTAGISNTHSDLSYSMEAYRESYLALQQKNLGVSKSIFIYNDNLTKLFDNDNKKNSFYLTKLNFYQKKLWNCLLYYSERVYLTQLIDSLFIDIKHSDFTIQEARRFCEELLLLTASNIMKMLGAQPKEDFNVSRYCSIFRLSDRKALSALKIDLTNCINKLLMNIPGNESGKNNNLLLKVDELLSNHCDTITLQNVADSVKLSPAYFSMLFKEQSGENYKSYVLNYKIKLAQSMLIKSNVTILEIAEKLGYQNPNYFSKVFKRNTGLTPSEYRLKADDL